MSRRIIRTQLQASKNAGKIDNSVDRIIKYIPSEIVAAWMTITGLLQNDSGTQVEGLWILFIVFILATAAWIYFLTSEKNQPPAIQQTWISTGAFIVWVFALGEPFASSFPNFYRPQYGSIGLILYTLLITFVEIYEERQAKV